jgi:ABC-2 type transport system permease protein
VIAVALALGFHADAGMLDWLAALGLLVGFMVAVAWLSAAIGLLARSPEAANGVAFVVMVVPYASSAFVPVDTMPSWLQGFAAHQPITPLADALRALLLGTPVGSSAAVALVWCGGILAASRWLRQASCSRAATTATPDPSAAAERAAAATT